MPSLELYDSRWAVSVEALGKLFREGALQDTPSINLFNVCATDLATRSTPLQFGEKDILVYCWSRCVYESFFELFASDLSHACNIDHQGLRYRRFRAGRLVVFSVPAGQLRSPTEMTSE